MYAYRLNGFLVILATVQIVWIGGLLAIGKAFYGASGFAVSIYWQLLLPWVTGIMVENLLRAMSRAPMLLSWKSAAFRGTGAASVAGLFWLSGLGAGENSSWLFQLWLGCWMTLVALYGGVPHLILKVCFSENNRQRVLLIGETEKAASLQTTILERGLLGIVSVGSLKPNFRMESQRLEGAGDCVSELEEIVRKERIQQVILADGSVDAVAIGGVAAICAQLGIRFILAQELGFGMRRNILWETEGEWCFGAVTREPLQSPFNRIVKRSLDVAVSLCAIGLLIVPVLIVTFMAQLIQSRGTLFCRQWRHGRDNKPFRIWKFRTMHMNCKDIARQAVREDCRVFPFGKILRRHSLDELPQFFNVLSGEMSVVGPRPHLVEHTAAFATAPRYQLRSFVKPGITGLAQVNGSRGEILHPEDLTRRVDLDIKYVESWSLFLDLKIMCRTFGELIVPSGAAY